MDETRFRYGLAGASAFVTLLIFVVVSYSNHQAVAQESNKLLKPPVDSAQTNEVRQARPVELADVVVIDDAVGDARERHLRVTVKANGLVERQNVEIQVHVYDLLDNKDVVQTNAAVEQRWVDYPVDWAGEGIEVLDVKSKLPAPKMVEGRSAEDRKYYGYAIGLFYKNELQATRAAPEELLNGYLATHITTDLANKVAVNRVSELGVYSVAAVNRGSNIVLMKLGEQSGIAQNSIMKVYHDNIVVGAVKITEVMTGSSTSGKSGMAVGDIIKSSDGSDAEIQLNDDVYPEGKAPSEREEAYDKAAKIFKRALRTFERAALKPLPESIRVYEEAEEILKELEATHPKWEKEIVESLRRRIAESQKKP